MSKAQQPIDTSWGSYFWSWLPFTSNNTGQEMLKDDKGTYQEMQVMKQYVSIENEQNPRQEIKGEKNGTARKPKKKSLNTKVTKGAQQEKDNNDKLSENNQLIGDKITTASIDDEMVYVGYSPESDKNDSYWYGAKKWVSNHKGITIAGGILVTLAGVALSAYLYYLLFLSKNNVNNPSIGQDNNNSNGTSYGDNQYSGTSIEDLVTIYNKTASTTPKPTKPPPTRTTMPFDNAFQQFFECFRITPTTYKQRIKQCMKKDFGKKNCRKIVEEIDKCNNVYVKGVDPKKPFLDNKGISQLSDFSKCIRGEKYTDDMHYVMYHKYLTGAINDYCD